MTITIKNHELLIGGVKLQDLPRLARPATVHVWAVPAAYVGSGYFVDVQQAGHQMTIPACRSADAWRVAMLELEPDDGAVAADARSGRLAQANADADALLALLEDPYPTREVWTWDQQAKEAEQLQMDSSAATPLLSWLAAGRSIEVDDLAVRVLQKSALYKEASGKILGARQWVEDRLDEADDHAAVLAVPTLAERLAVLPETLE